MTICLDAWAIIAWLENVEPAATRVNDLLLDERPVMSWVNAGEVCYQVQRRRTRRDAIQVIRSLRSALNLELPGEERVLQAADIKAEHPVAYADAFAVATAIAWDAVLLTGDPEILTATAGWPVEDLR
jgi:predicted nucleic acid-binding protein